MAKAFSGNDKVGDISAKYPWANEVLQRHGIDPGMVGPKELTEAVKGGTSEVTAVLQDLNAAYRSNEDPSGGKVGM